MRANLPSYRTYVNDVHQTGRVQLVERVMHQYLVVEVVSTFDGLFDRPRRANVSRIPGTVKIVGDVINGRCIHRASSELTNADRISCTILRSAFIGLDTDTLTVSTDTMV